MVRVAVHNRTVRRVQTPPRKGAKYYQKRGRVTVTSRESERHSYRAGIDIGGTFTDLIVVDRASGRVTVEKTPSIPANPWEGIVDGLRHVDGGAQLMDMIVHGTTIGINAILERRGHLTGLITTHGFRDVYEIARHNRIETYDLFYRKPQPIVPRRHRLEVSERIDANGNVVTPLAVDDVRACVRSFRKASIDSIAVCFLNAYASPAHELEAGAIIAEDFPQATVSLSHELVRQWREYERTSTTVINAYIMPVMDDYLEKVEAGLAELGYARPFFVSQSSGGIMPVAAAKRKPVHTIMSGPAGGVVASAHVGRMSGYSNVITFDMGGTSTDVALVHDGELRVTAESEIDRHPIMVPMIAIKSIGAGGGSIAKIGTAGELLVGPQSAGAKPGPVAYGTGATEPTVTDAHVALGRLHPEHFLGGGMGLDVDAARRQLEARIAEPLGLGLEEAANGILEVINTKMAYAVRAITLERGLNPQDFVLLAFGGAGPMHACAIARTLGIPEVIVPIVPGAFSAYGLLISDIRHDFVRTIPLATAADGVFDAIDSVFAEMTDQAHSAMVADGADQEAMTLIPSLDLRYVGQEYTINVPLPSASLDPPGLEDIRRRFHELHDRTYGHSSTEEPTEVVNLRLAVIGHVQKPEIAGIQCGPEAPAEDAHLGDIDAHFQSSGSTSLTPVYRRDYLLAGNRFVGPVIIVEKTATTIVEPGFALEVTAPGHLSMKRAA